MLAVSATDVAIALAKERGELKVTKHQGRFGEYWAISDRVGIIEVALSEQEAQRRVDSVGQEG